MRPRYILLFLFVIGIAHVYSDDSSIVEDQKDEITFKAHIEPIFEKNCLRCHKSWLLSQGGLRLNSIKFILKGGDSGPAVLPGEPDNSLLIKRITADKDDERRMPPEDNEALHAKEILLIKKWIQQGIK